MKNAKDELFYDKALNWLIDKGPGILLGFALLFIGFWLIKVVSRWMHRGLNKHEIDPSLKPFLLSLFISALRILLVIGVMQIMGIEMTIFVALLGAMGVAAGLALSGTLQNFASGVLILVLKPFRVGDNVVAQGQEGTVSSIQIFYTIITTFDNRTVVVPNSKLSNEVIVNISTKGSRRLDVEVKVSYKSDYESVVKIVEETIESAENMLKKPECRIGVASFEAEVYVVLINVWVKAHGFVDTKLKFQQMLLTNLYKAKVAIGK